MVNPHKSMIWFSSKCNDECQQLVLREINAGLATATAMNRRILAQIRHAWDAPCRMNSTFAYEGLALAAWFYHDTYHNHWGNGRSTDCMCLSKARSSMVRKYYRYLWLPRQMLWLCRTLSTASQAGPSAIRIHIGTYRWIVGYSWKGGDRIGTLQHTGKVTRVKIYCHNCSWSAARTEAEELMIPHQAMQNLIHAGWLGKVMICTDCKILVRAIQQGSM